MQSANPLELPIENSMLKNLLERCSGLRQLHSWYEQWSQVRSQYGRSEARAFLQFASSKLGVDLSLQGERTVWKAAESGPVIFVANHPLGLLDSMLLTERLLDVRGDLKVLANQVLLRFSELSDVLLGVDVFTAGAQHGNAASVRALNGHLRDGGAALIFPAGRVASLKLLNFIAMDAPWHSMGNPSGIAGVTFQTSLQ